VTPTHDINAVSILQAAAHALDDRKDEVNRLNVFPVPDGDTGTNMALTMDAVLTEAAKLPPSPSLIEVCHAVTHGSLMGARGNSGVILSQILRGLCEVLQDAGKIEPEVIRDALDRSVKVAFQAVRKPVEGTMLTVIKDSAEAAIRLVEEEVDLGSLLEAIVVEAQESVLRTPELLPVLKEAGVVDAGGFGLVLLAEGFVSALQGYDVRSFDVTSTSDGSLATAIVLENDWDDEEYLYCTEFLLHGHDLDQDAILSFVSSVGGSELVVGDVGLLKVHVHTDDPGIVIAHATEVGQVAEVHIHNMRLQTADRTAMLASETTQDDPMSPFGIVAVCAGKGLADMLQSLGIDAIVSGGQTMNPSTAELAEAAASTHAENVIILPNNKNILMAAEQVAGVTDFSVGVVPTSSVPQAFAALLAFDTGVSLDENIREMSDAAKEVRVGEITTAIKDSKSPTVGDIKTGQVIGIAEHEIVAAGKDIKTVTVSVFERLAGDGETLTLLAGEDLTDEDFHEITRLIEERFPDYDVESYRGDQPLYPLILSVE